MILSTSSENPVTAEEIGRLVAKRPKRSSWRFIDYIDTFPAPPKSSEACALLYEQLREISVRLAIPIVISTQERKPLRDIINAI